MNRLLWLSAVAAGLVSAAAALGARLIAQALRRRAENRTMTQRAVAVADAHQALAAAMRAYGAALKDGDVEAYGALFVDDCLSLPARGPVVRGRKALRAAMAATFASTRFLDVETSSLDVRFDGDHAYETGTFAFVLSAARASHPESASGRYVIVWRCVAGTWKIALEAAQPDAPPR